MPEFKHTPGPWVLNRHGAIVGGEFHQYTNGSAQSQLAMATGGNGISDEERKANSFLIAASPELLDALRELLICVELENTEGVEEGRIEAAQCTARQAIVKAAGATQ
jgi:hypothetical protein